MRVILICVALAILPGRARAGDPTPLVVFMEAEAQQSPDALPTYQLVQDPLRLEKYRMWLDNDSARRAIDLYERTWKTVQQRDPGAEKPPYHVALVPGGNHAAVGFRLRSASGLQDYPRVAYIKLDDQRWRFSTTFLHETGHVVLSTLNGGHEIPSRQIASIPHTTAALTDRGTAFNEGFAIHLETLVAHMASDPATRRRYRHEQFDFGGDKIGSSEYYRHASDLLSFSQTIARYYEVRENTFAFASACDRAEYLRVQMEKSRDFAALRNANQLLQSEGFYASFFFSYTMCGEAIPSNDTIRARQDKVLAVLAEMMDNQPAMPDSPHLLRFVETFLHMYPSEAADMVNVLLDLSHGVFLDSHAAELWRDFYLAALRLDMNGLPTAQIEEARQRWRTEVLSNPAVLYSRVGPQIPCVVPKCSVQLVALGEAAPLSFDLNTVQPGIMRMIPQISEEEIACWHQQRTLKPFADDEDFKRRCPLRDVVISELEFKR